ncbi:protein kinase [bacterium]|nr:protein kinase [bacterium]
MTRSETRNDLDRQSDATRSFRTATVAVTSVAESTGDSHPTTSPGLDATLLHERFRIGARLGEGGMGIVYRARDNRDGREVALKLMKGNIVGTARRRFEREFRSLAALSHPHCLSVYDYGELAGGPFFTMELFPGQPITSLISRPLADRFEPLLQLTHALDYIHSHAIVHRDVKPSNVMVRLAARGDGTAHFETRLMDFGLAKYYGVSSSLSAEAGFVGTVAYCAPEQVNLDELDHRADLYCLGLVAYELLGGRYAFPEARLAGMRPLLQAQLNEKPRHLSEVNPEVPAPIAEAVMKYLRKLPRRRPDSAAALRAVIAGYLGIDERSIVSGVSLVELRPRLSVTGFVCRSKEQEAIGDLFQRSLRPSNLADQEVPPSLVVVSGEPGIGKSTVMQEAERIARRHGCQVFEGRCFDGNLSPFQPFVEILRQLIAEMRLQERNEAVVQADDDLTGTHVSDMPERALVRLQAIVKNYRGELLRIAPELRKYLPGEAYHQVDYGREADYIHRALSALFLEIATIQPICLSFEDLQWADKSSLDLLRHLAAALAEARRPESDRSTVVPQLIIVASARAGYDQLESLMAQLRDRRQVHEIRLSLLVESETREMIALRLNCLPEELSDDLVARVHQLCGGNPFFVAETVRDWYEKNAISRSDNAWVLSAEAADSTDLPETVRDVMRLRLQGLPPKVQQVINASAVIGVLVEIDCLKEVLPDLSETDVLDAIDMLIPRRVFRETGNAGRVEFVHDLLREMPLADMTASRRRSLHRRVGELLELRRATGQFVAPALLAEHFRNADEQLKAFGYGMEAAQAALDAYAFNNAVTHLEDALKLQPDNAESATLYRFFEMLATAHSASGRLDEAISNYEKALEHATSAIQKGRVHYGIGEAYHRKGDFEAATRFFGRALSDVGFPRSNSRAGRLLDMWMTSVYFHLLPHWCRRPVNGPDRNERIGLAISTYLRLCQINGQRSTFEYTHNTYKIVGFAKRLRSPEFVAIAYSKLGLNCGIFGLHRLGMAFIQRARKAAETSSRDDLKAMAEGHIGGALYFSGRLDAAESHLLNAIPVLDKVGDWFGFFSHHTLRHLYSVRGDFAAAIAEADREITTATTRGDRETLCWGQYGKADALARVGRIVEANDIALRAVEELASFRSTTEGIALGVLGLVRLQASDYAGAREALERSRTRLYKSAFVVEFSGPTFPLLVESLLGPRWFMPETQYGPGRTSARKAWREARTARAIGRLYPNYWPHVLRVSGRAAQALAKTNKAASYFERSIVSAEKLGARYELARALLDASLVIPDRAEEYRRRGQQLLSEVGGVIPEAESQLF